MQSQMAGHQVYKVTSSKNLVQFIGSLANGGSARAGRGTKPKIATFSRVCDKHFRTETQASAFISDWIEMFACVAKANIKNELLKGYRPENNQNWSLSFEYKKGVDDAEGFADDSEAILLV